MAKSKLAKANEKIAETVTEGYKEIEKGVVGGFNRMTDKFVDQFLTREGETVEQAKERLSREQTEREEARKAEEEKRAAAQAERMARAKAASGVHVELPHVDIPGEHGKK